MMRARILLRRRLRNGQGRHLHSAGDRVAGWVFSWTSIRDGPDARATPDGGGEIPRRVGERLGPTARVSKDQARSVRDERPGAPRLREPGIPPGTPLYGEATRVSLPDMLGVAQLTTKGLNNGAIVFGDAG